VKTRITFGFGDGGAEFKFYDYEDAEPAKDAQPTYELALSDKELDAVLVTVQRGRRRSLWARIKAVLK